MPTTSFFIRERFLGTLRARTTFEACPWGYYSYAYFCPVCGEVWARVVCDRDVPEPLRWHVREHPCEQHSTIWHVSGTLLPGSDLINLDVLPPEVLRYEFQQHLSHYERKK